MSGLRARFLFFCNTQHISLYKYGCNKNLVPDWLYAVKSNPSSARLVEPNTSTNHTYSNKFVFPNGTYQHPLSAQESQVQQQHHLHGQQQAVDLQHQKPNFQGFLLITMTFFRSIFICSLHFISFKVFTLNSLL